MVLDTMGGGQGENETAGRRRENSRRRRSLGLSPRGRTQTSKPGTVYQEGSFKSRSNKIGTRFLFVLPTSSVLMTIISKL